MKIYENDEIYVRPFLESDITDNYLSWFYDQEVCKYNSHGKMSHTFKLNNSDPKATIVWSVMKKNWPRSKDFHIGKVVLEINWINRNAEFACIFGEKEYWGKGYCTQTLKWIIAHGFNKLNLHKIWLGTANSGMGIAANRSGMAPESLLIDEVFLDARYKNITRWSIINDK